MHLKTTLDLPAKKTLQQPIAGPPPHELVNHETLWLKNFLSKQTQQTYRAVFREFCRLGEITSPDALRQVTPAEIISYRDYLIEVKGMRPRSVRNRLAAISSLFQHLKNAQVVALNPVEAIQRPKIDRERGVTPAMATHPGGATARSSGYQHPGGRPRQRDPASAVFYRLPDLRARTIAGEGSFDDETPRSLE